ncbi:NUDIX hydrolase [Streptomyces sp. NPDC090077]|uniref:NUDIX hydrolase n=1 Tax=Streptomyces sp. NPDC090077 TaxID=3365938 RepID=UPI00382DE11B
MTVPEEPRGAAALLVDSRGRYLLHLRDANKRICDPGTWSITVGTATARSRRRDHFDAATDGPGDQPGTGFVFRARRWTGTPEVREPDRCVSWDWWPADALPEPVVPYARTAIEGIRAGRLYSEIGRE